MNEKLNNLVALSFDCSANPTIVPSNISETSESGKWGLAWYPQDGNVAGLMKDTISMECVMMSTTTIAFLEKSHYVAPLMDTQPFIRPYAGRDWIWCSCPHISELGLQQEFQFPPPFMPAGTTNSEKAFCQFLSRLNEGSWHRISQIPLDELKKVIKKIICIHKESFIVADGDSLLCYAGEGTDSSLHQTRICHSVLGTKFTNDAFSMALTDPLDETKTMLAISTSPFSGDDDWEAIPPGSVLLVKNGQVVFSCQLAKSTQEKEEAAETKALEEAIESGMLPPTELIPTGRKMRYKEHPHYTKPPKETIKPIRYHISHKTTYEYKSWVEYSTHTLRLRPKKLENQKIIDYSLTLSQDTKLLDYEDVFGNPAVYTILNFPYKKLEITSQLLIDCLPNFTDFTHPLRQISIPLFWTPWQRQMMNSYLLPIELPETELKELSDYAMSFVQRNDYDLLETVLNINQTIYHDYKYVPGSTDVSTTPYQVYHKRSGVCQDFANLFICLARLINVPARYRVGYIFTGGDYENKIQSDASHAWVELYLPYIGWQGFDPTNGILANEDHICVACGRNYLDATPTSGTIYRGGGTELLDVEVKVLVAEEMEQLEKK